VRGLGVRARGESPLQPAVEPGAVRLASGERLVADAVVVAVEGPSARRLLGEAVPEQRWLGVTCLSFDAPEPPIEAPWLVLGGDGDGPVNNLCVPSQVAPAYAPDGRSLVSATVLGDPTRGDPRRLEADVRRQLQGWFGPDVQGWRLLRLDRIARALPVPQLAGAPPALPRGLHVAGDHLDLPSIQHAMASGRRAAAAVLAEAGAGPQADPALPPGD
jgi:phytoene dehydrogenase-like protein